MKVSVFNIVYSWFFCALGLISFALGLGLNPLGITNAAESIIMIICGLVCFSASHEELGKYTDFQDEMKEILEIGESFCGKIFDYDYNSELNIFGKPMVVLIVRFYKNDKELMEIHIPADTTKESKYPIGCNVSFKIDEIEGKAALEHNQNLCEFIHKEKELVLSNTKSIENNKSISVFCPDCGYIESTYIGINVNCSICEKTISVSGRQIIKKKNNS